MRRFFIAAVPLVAGLVAAPAQAQVSARVHIDIPIGRQPPVYQGPRRQIVVREYDQRRYGEWDRYYDEWIPETVYYYDGYYYDYPIVAYAQPIIVYRYRNEIFFAPRQRDFIVWRDRYRPQSYRGNYGYDNRRDNDRDYRPGNRDNRDNRNDGRYDGRYDPRDNGRYDPRGNGNNGRGGRDGRDDDRGGRQGGPQNGGRDNRDARPSQPQGGRVFGGQIQGQGRGNGPGRDAGRSRPRGF